MNSEPSPGLRYSIIFLLEEESIGFAHFVMSIHETFAEQPEPFEIIIVANGTEHFLTRELQQLPAGATNATGKADRIKAFALNKKTPQAVCLLAGFNESQGEIIVVCGSYQQISNDSFKALLGALDDKTDIVSPWRKNRVDPKFNQLQSRAFNKIVKKIIGSSLNDLSCTVKVFRRAVLEQTNLYGNMYRFLPIVAAKQGFTNKEVECEHYQERGKTGFYNPLDYFSRILDIATLYFNTRFSRKPLRFFNLFGAAFFMFGLAIGCYVLLQKILLGHPIGGRPVLLLAILSMVLGVQAASVGLLGEIIAFTQGRRTKEYNIDKII